MPNMPAIGYRKDILEALGNPPMTTMEEFKTVLGMVKEQYPDMTPLATNSTVSWRFMPFFVWAGAGNQILTENADGTVQTMFSRPEYADALRQINEMYRLGYISADNLSLSDSDSTALWQNGQAFAFCHTSNGELYRNAQNAVAIDPNVVVAEVPPLGDGSYYETAVGWCGTFINKNCENPDAAINFVKFLFSEEGQRLSMWGREGIEYTLDAEGLPVFTQEWIDSSVDPVAHFANYNPGFYFGASTGVEMTGMQAALPAEYRATSNATVVKDRILYQPWISLATPQGEIAETAIYTTLIDLLTNAQVQVILSASEEEFETNLAEHLADAEEIGSKELEAYMTTRILDFK
jgi:putative aldouronate transport system substrate-binding protein